MIEPPRLFANGRGACSVGGKRFGAEVSRLSKQEYNRQLVLALLSDRGPASRQQLGRMAGFSPAALTAISKDLLRRGIIREGPTVASVQRAGGRRHTLLELDTANVGVVGLSYGRDRIEASIATLSGELCWHQEWGGAFVKNRVGLLKGLKRALLTALSCSPLARARLACVGVSNPALVNRSTGEVVRSVALPGWENIPLGSTLLRTAGIPVIVERDSALQALGESMFGAGRGARSSFLVTATPTGIGGAIVERGRLFFSRDLSNGQIGHIRISEGGPRCGCGLRGCLEAHISVPALLEQAKRSMNLGEIGFAALAARARAGDQACRKVLGGAGEKLARAVGIVVNLLNPERLILGGHFLDAGNAFLDPLRRLLPRYVVPSLMESLDIRVAERGEAARFLGVAALAREKLFGYPTQGGGPIDR